MPEGSVSAVSTSIAKLNDDFVRGPGAAHQRSRPRSSRSREMQARRNEILGRAAPGRRPTPVVDRPQHPDRRALAVELARLGEQYKEGHPEVQKVQVAGRPAQKAKRAARATQILDGLDARSTRSSRSARRSCGGRSTTEKAQAANQSRKATELEALKKEADSAKSLYDVLLQKLNETDIAASIRSNNVSVVERAVPRPAARSARTSSGSPPSACCSGSLPASASCSRATTSTTPSRTRRRSSATCTSTCWPRCRATTRPTSTSSPRPTRTCARRCSSRRSDERGPGRAGHRHRAPGGQDDHDREPRAAAGRLGREDRSSSTATCAARQLHQRLGVAARAGLHRPLRAQGAARLAGPADATCRTSSSLTAGPLPPNPPALLARKQLGELFAELRARLRLGADRLAAARLGDGRAAAGAPRRPHAARRPAQQGRQEAGQAQHPERAAQGDAEPARRGPERGRRAARGATTTTTTRRASAPAAHAAPQAGGRPEAAGPRGAAAT